MSEDNRAPEVARLVAEHHGSLFGYAYRLTGSVADAEDLTQQAYLVAQQKLDQLRDGQCVRSWLLAIVRNAFLKARRRKRLVLLEPGETGLDGLAGPQSADDEIDRERLQAALNDLPDEFRLVLLMFYFEECPYHEIACRLELPIGTVMSRLSRAKGHLRRRLFPATESAIPRPHPRPLAQRRS